MVDWSSREREKILIERMEAAATSPSGLPPATTIVREEGSDLNGGEALPVKPRVKRGRVQRLPNCESKPSSAKQKVDPPKDKGKTSAQRKRKVKDAYLLGVQNTKTSNMVLYYPNAALLKNLCDKVGTSPRSSESFPKKIFNQLKHNDVQYPYASLLHALHRYAGVTNNNTNSPSTEKSSRSNQKPSTTLGLGRVMRNLSYPTTSHREKRTEEKRDPPTPFSTLLKAIVTREKKRTSTKASKVRNPACSLGGIGEILKKEMPHSQKDDPPTSELSSAFLLQKLSFSAQKDLQVPETTLTSSESQQSEENRDWLVERLMANKVTKETFKPRKKKKTSITSTPITNTSITSTSITNTSVSCDIQPNTSQVNNNNLPPGTVTIRLRYPASAATRIKLLKFIIRRQQRTSEERSEGDPETDNKRKRLETDENEDSDNLWVATGLTDAYEKPLEKETNPAGGESQSLLKEYLLKPAGKEGMPNENCDIPKLESNFLFSRLLQNFKNLAESNQPEEHSKNTLECDDNPSILRGMLAPTILHEEHPMEFSQSSHNTSCSSSSEQQQQQQSSTPSEHSSEAMITGVKMEEDIKVECEEEEIVCKLECEEDSFECHVCHLQFSSLTDLSNHQVLFHCTDEQQTSTPSRLLGCSVEGLGAGVMQGKQPA